MAKQKPLVCKHLENISGDVLSRYRNVIRDYVKGQHGVYALYQKNRLQYVGLASNLRSRLGHHLKDRHAGTWDSFSVYLTVIVIGVIGVRPDYGLIVLDAPLKSRSYAQGIEGQAFIGVEF